MLHLPEQAAVEARPQTVLEAVKLVMAENGLTEMDALKRVARERGIGKSEAYRDLQREQQKQKPRSR